MSGSKVFVSSTYSDLKAHRTAVKNVLNRMQLTFIGMEYFGSRGDEPTRVCEEEIRNCDVFIGIYAWRYGWQPSPNHPSITELEFEIACRQNKTCLCYIIDENYPWPPGLMDLGKPADRLQKLKIKVSRLVRSKFTTADNLAAQVAADVVRELGRPLPPDSFGALVRVNWEVFSPEMQRVLMTAWSQARVEAPDGIVAIRHIVTALASTPSTATSLILALKNVQIQPLRDSLPDARIEDLFTYEKPLSSCVLASMNRVLPDHSPSQRLMALELAIDLIKKGDSSVTEFRHAQIDPGAIDRTISHIQRVSADWKLLGDALHSLDEALVLHMAYVSGIESLENVNLKNLPEEVLKKAEKQDKVLVLVGEIMRRNPGLITF